MVGGRQTTLTYDWPIERLLVLDEAGFGSR